MADDGPESHMSPRLRRHLYEATHPLSDEQDVSTAVAASLHYEVHDTSVLQKAIFMSLRENNNIETKNQEKQEVVNDASENAGKTNLGKGKGSDEESGEISERETLDSRIRDLSLKVAFELPLISDPHGDTFVFIDPPDRQPEQDDESYQRYIARYKMPMLMKKDVFMRLGSSYFEKAFGATNQHRVVRRRGLLGKLPDHIKYVLDLTPPTEGDQAVYLTTELCCSDGVRKWYQATRRWNVAKSLVAGQEEYMLPQKAWSGAAGMQVGSHTFLPVMQNPCIPLEYSPVRHRSAIERVLSALQGSDPKLDSAPKVWTTFAVARYFDITHSPLTDYIVRWLRASPNACFLEVLPETALRIADGLQCHDLCRDTFAILVGEEALGSLYRSRVPEFDNSVSVHGRKKEPLPEDMKTRVEYASKAFSDRINAEFSSLVDGGMRWIDDLPEVQRLFKLGTLPSSLDKDRTNLIVLLKDYIKGSIYTILCTNFPYTLNQTKSPEDDLFPRTSWKETWAILTPRERILTRSFWEVLRWCDLLRGPTNLHLRLQLPSGHMDSEGDAQKAIGLDAAFDRIKNQDVKTLILSLKNSYVEYCSTLIKDHVMNQGNAENRATFSVAHAGWASDGASLNPKTEYGSTENLLPKDRLNGVVSKMSPTHSISQEDGFGFQTKSDTGNSASVDDEPDFYFRAFRAIQGGTTTPEFFDFDNFRFQAEGYFRTLSSRMLSAPDSSVRAEGLEVELTRTLVCLKDSELKFLPMWAGGNDDGSGGVFNDDVPFSHDGFSTAGPKIVTGKRLGADDNSTESSFTVLSDSGSSRPNTSMMNHNGFSDTLPRGIAVSNDGRSLASSRTLDSYDLVSNTVSAADDADDEVQRMEGLLDHLQVDDFNGNQEEKASVKSAKVDDVFDDIFTFSSGEEDDDDDGDTVNGDDSSDMEMD